MKTTEIKEGKVLYRDLPENVEKTLKEVIPEEFSNLPSDTLELGLDANVAMEILQNTIYSNKYIWMQEIPSNAYDAIKRRESIDPSFVGKGHITITIDQDNVFRIQDNGIGISRRVFEEIYRIYGRSDKRNTDAEVGMFGLGAKSPFAMVDSFKVRTVSIEDKKVYEAMITKSGISFTVNGRNKTNGEQYGTEVIITIPGYPSSYDMRDNMMKITRFWDIPVEVTWDRMRWDNKNIAQEDFNKTYNTYIKIETDDFVLYPWASDDDYYSRIYINHIPYRVNLHGNWEGSIIFLTNPHLLRLTANREQIQHDDKWTLFKELLETELKAKMVEALDEYFSDAFDIDKAGNELGYYIKAASSIRYQNDIVKVLSTWIRYGHYNRWGRRTSGTRTLANFDVNSTFWVKYSASGSSVNQATNDDTATTNDINVIYMRNINDEKISEWVKTRFKNLKEEYPPIRGGGGGGPKPKTFVLYCPAEYHWNPPVKHWISKLGDLPNKLPILSDKDARPSEFYNTTKVTHAARVKNLQKAGYPIVDREGLNRAMKKLKLIPDIDGKLWSINQLKRKKVIRVSRYNNIPESIFELLKEDGIVYITSDHRLLSIFPLKYEKKLSDHTVIDSREIVISNPTVSDIVRYRGQGNAEVREVEPNA